MFRRIHHPLCAPHEGMRDGGGSGASFPDLERGELRHRPVPQVVNHPLGSLTGQNACVDAGNRAANKFQDSIDTGDRPEIETRKKKSEIMGDFYHNLSAQEAASAANQAILVPLAVTAASTLATGAGLPLHDVQVFNSSFAASATIPSYLKTARSQVHSDLASQDAEMCNRAERALREQDRSNGQGNIRRRRPE